MKIGVISDTHVAGVSLNPKKLASVIINMVTSSPAELCDLIRPHFKDVDMIIHAGDFVSLPVITALEEFGPVHGVAGNMDPHEITSRLPSKKVVSADGLKIGIMHGYGPPTGLEHKIRSEFDSVDLIVFGHSHYPFNGVVKDVLMFNPGSPTDRRFAKSRSIGVIEIGKTVTARHINLD